MKTITLIKTHFESVIQFLIYHFAFFPYPVHQISLKMSGERSNLNFKRQSHQEFYTSFNELISYPVPKSRKQTSTSSILQNTDSFMEEVKEIIESHMSTGNVSVKSIAESLNISERTLLRKVKAKTGQTAVSFINQYKIKLAARLMENTKYLNITEIMYSVGFNSLSYFCKEFKKYYNLTPSEYKNLKSNYNNSETDNF